LYLGCIFIHLAELINKNDGSEFDHGAMAGVRTPRGQHG